MRILNEETGEALYVPPPDENNEGVIFLDGEIVERCFYSTEMECITLGDGRDFTPLQFSVFLSQQLQSGAYRNAKHQQPQR